MSVQSDELRVGAAVYAPAGIIEFKRYRTGEIAIEVFDDEGSSYMASVAMVPSGAPHPGEFCVWLKGWTENEGVPEALAAAGVVRLTGRVFPTGYTDAVHGELTELARAVLLKQLGVS